MASVGPAAPATSTEKHLKIRNHPVQNVSRVAGENPELSQPVHAAVKIKKKKLALIELAMQSGRDSERC